MSAGPDTIGGGPVLACGSPVTLNWFRLFRPFSGNTCKSQLYFGKNCINIACILWKTALKRVAWRGYKFKNCRNRERVYEENCSCFRCHVSGPTRRWWSGFTFHTFHQQPLGPQMKCQFSSTQKSSRLQDVSCPSAVLLLRLLILVESSWGHVNRVLTKSSFYRLFETRSWAALRHLKMKTCGHSKMFSPPKVSWWLMILWRRSRYPWWGGGLAASEANSRLINSKKSLKERRLLICADDWWYCGCHRWNFIMVLSLMQTSPRIVDLQQRWSGGGAHSH